MSEIKLDKRYTIAREYNDQAKPVFVVRFCGEYIDYGAGYEMAYNIALRHRINFCSQVGISHD